MLLTAVLTPAEEGGFVAFNPETGTTTQGETVHEAVANLKEATTLYLEEFPIKNQRSGRSVVFCAKLVFQPRILPSPYAVDSLSRAKSASASSLSSRFSSRKACQVMIFG
jgi:predicted RNase H-like HicB family nuclease